MDEQNTYTVNLYDLDYLTEDILLEWEALEGISYDPNVYISSSFIFPAIKNLRGNKVIKILIVFSNLANVRKLCAAAVLEERKINYHFPFKSLALYKSPHTFLNGILIDKARSEDIMHAIYCFFKKKSHNYYGLALNEVANNSFVNSWIKKNCSGLWYEIDSYKRACIDVNESFLSDTISCVSKKRKRNLKQNWNALSKIGNLEWMSLQGSDVTMDTLNNFLMLEDASWKGDKGTSILANTQHKNFMEEVFIRAAGKNQLLFTELRLDKKLIASTFNFIIDDTLYAFKVASDPAYSKFSPGSLNELKFLENYHNLKIKLNFIESGAPQGSYIERFWCDRYKIESGILALNMISSIYIFGIKNIRKVKHYLVEIGNKLTKKKVV